MDKEKLNIYTAIERMKALSAEGKTFALKFRKWNRAAKRGGDLVSLGAARLRPKTDDDAIANSSYKLFITDTDTGSPMVCWQALLVEFDGHKLFLK